MDPGRQPGDGLDRAGNIAGGDINPDAADPQGTDGGNIQPVFHGTPGLSLAGLFRLRGGIGAARDCRISARQCRGLAGQSP